MKKLLSIVALLGVIATAACGNGPTRSDGVADYILPPIADANRVTVRSQTEPKPLRVITEPGTIGELRRFVNSHPAGWSVPWAGAPVGRIYFDFYSNGTFIGNFYVGPGFFGRDHENVYLRKANDAEIARLNAVVGFNVLE